MNIQWNFRGRVIYNENEKFLEVPSIIKKTIILEHSIIILLEQNVATGNQNIYCYGFDKKLKWKIAPPVEFHAENDFTGVYLRNDDLFAYNRNGIEYRLGKETGKVLDSQLIK